MTEVERMLSRQVATWETMGHPAIVERFVLRNGTARKGRPYSGPRGTPKECFANAARLALEDRKATYVEGFVHRKDFPIVIHHAWCQKGSRLVEVTLPDPEKFTYMGVSIDREVLSSQLVRNGVYGLLDTGTINYRLMFELDPGLRPEVERVIGRRLT